MPTLHPSKRWRSPRTVIAFFAAELIFTVPVLALFALADPNTYRTRLRQDGYDNGFNSNPLEVLYAYANHRELPKVPLVWSHRDYVDATGCRSVSHDSPHLATCENLETRSTNFPTLTHYTNSPSKDHRYI